MVTLAGELSSETKPPESRRLAGIILKNLLTAKVPYLKAILFIGVGYSRSAATATALGRSNR